MNRNLVSLDPGQGRFEARAVRPPPEQHLLAINLVI